MTIVQARGSVYRENIVNKEKKREDLKKECGKIWKIAGAVICLSAVAMFFCDVGIPAYMDRPLKSPYTLPIVRISEGVFQVAIITSIAFGAILTAELYLRA